jgi:hypothetical protein
MIAVSSNVMNRALQAQRPIAGYRDISKMRESAFAAFAAHVSYLSGKSSKSQ